MNNPKPMAVVESEQLSGYSTVYNVVVHNSAGQQVARLGAIDWEYARMLADAINEGVSWVSH